MRRRPQVSSPLALRSPTGKTSKKVMASLVNGTSGTPISDNASSAAPMPGSVKQSAKPATNASNKNGDLNRKQTNSPGNGAQRYDMSLVPTVLPLISLPSPKNISYSAAPLLQGFERCCAALPRPLWRAYAI